VTSFPQPWCPTCAAASPCRERGQVESEYPACRQPLRHLPVDNASRLLSWMCDFHRVEDARVERVVSEVARCLAEDSGYSEIFEPSLSTDDDWHLLRFSYAFPGFRGAPSEVLDRLRHLCAAFDPGTATHVDRLRPAFHHPCVEQPLFGLAYDSPSNWRVKLYLQFRDDAGPAATELAASILGSGDLAQVASGAPLHLVGLDLGSQGLLGAKLYFLHTDISLEELHAEVGRVPAIAGVSHWRNLLRIHRMRSPGDPRLSRAAEIDFALAENDLLPQQVESFFAGEPYQRLRSTFAIALRRMSLAVGDSGKANGYYVLTE